MATTLTPHNSSKAAEPVTIREQPLDSPFSHETPQQREARIQNTFSHFDKRSKGTLSIEDIEQGVIEYTPLLHRNFASEIFEALDRNKDGVVDYADFKYFIDHREAQLWKLFKNISDSKDHSVLPEELHAHLKSAGIELCEDELEDFISYIDYKSDGFVDFEEWRDFLLFVPHVHTISHIYDHYVDSAQMTSDGELVISEGTKSSQRSMFFFLLAGAVAGAISRTVTAPLDRLKVYLQTQTHTGKQSGLTLNTAVRHLYQSGGVANFFRGNGLNIVKIAPESAVKFYAYENCKLIVRSMFGFEDGEDLGISGRFLAGGFAGLASQTSIYPLEILKTRVMSSSGIANSSGSNSILIPTAKAMWKQEGMRAFFKGLFPALVGVFPFAAIDLSVFESLKHSYIRYTRNNGNPCQEPNVMVLLGCGMVSGTVGATMVYPLSLIRTRLQAQGTPGHPHTYTGAFDVIRTTYERETIRGFYKGLVPTLTKVVPAVSISYVVYEACKRNLGLVST
ncbi:mitochondrial carrier [Basidiobolus meristosporus CBS 931.73]|uniref:Mitochondrial carrier n=1 Tax=Basidiobolus meristosporus CBS 931.73 TaxID=1314790 RepID=A0A1Y1XT06_9FUNG|nr:mitochondrial carrier [Basidiobolus meristosporus CBS 931.73]|eukprot:ORX88868.1 mitochondrial carrier [Basidiobolus meristosporus CBS 931.73]